MDIIQKNEYMKTKQIEHRHLLDCSIAGFTYWDGVLAFNDLKIGTELRLQYEPDNEFDPYAIAIYYEKYKIGYIPRAENHQLSKFLEMGYTDIFEVRINRISPDVLPEEQVGIIIFIKSSSIVG